MPTAHELGSCISDLFNHRFKMAFLCLLMRTNRRLPSQKRARARHYARNVAAHQLPSTGKLMATVTLALTKPVMLSCQFATHSKIPTPFQEISRMKGRREVGAWELRVESLVAGCLR